MSSKKTILGIIIFFSFICISNGQELTGKVVNTENNSPVPFASVIISGTTKGTITDINGKFKTKAFINDSLVFSCLGYQQKVVVVKNYLPLQVKLTAKSYTLGQVNVLGEEQIPIRYRSEVYPTAPKIMSAVLSPFSYLYYKTSKREKSKRKIQEYIINVQRLSKAYSIYNKELVAEYSGLEGEELEACFIYCNANMKLNEFDNEFTIRSRLLQVLTDYKQKQDKQ